MFVLTIHGRPLRPMYKLVTSRFHVIAMSASTASIRDADGTRQTDVLAQVARALDHHAARCSTR